MLFVSQRWAARAVSFAFAALFALAIILKGVSIETQHFS